jgi:hypothetical protein
MKVFFRRECPLRKLPVSPIMCCVWRGVGGEKGVGGFVVSIEGRHRDLVLVFVALLDVGPDPSRGARLYQDLTRFFVGCQMRPVATHAVRRRSTSRLETRLALQYTF